ncbi:MAG: NADP oxidoreductase [Chitinophagaceae bacterium]|nr:MAG: NADP oxidoreductase [Chitinophagaceae bacterium]
MNIGILGTGPVGETLASALVQQGHRVTMGSRKAGNEKARAWAARTGSDALEGSFGDAAAFGEMLFLCVAGAATLEAVRLAGVAHFSGKIVVDVTNPLDFSKGMPPRILKEYRDVSLGEQVQQLLPKGRVVKALNTMTSRLMVDAQQVGNGDHELFLCGNDPIAKLELIELLCENFHWRQEHIIDLGDINTAGALEATVPLWVLLYGQLGTGMFNYKLVQQTV